MAPSCQLQLACSIHSGFLGFPEISAHMFLRAQGRERLRYSLKCSFLEIYNETITDLLNPAAYNLQIRGRHPARLLCGGTFRGNRFER